MKYVRQLKENDRKAQLELICEGFPWNTPSAMKERFDLLADHSDSFGSFEGDVLASQIISTPYTINFYNTKYSMAGIGFVATSQHYQHQHRIDDLMSSIFEFLYRKGCVLSFLAPFSYRFYRRFGYEKVFDMLDFTIDPSDLPIKDHSYRIDSMDWQHAKDILHKLYENNAMCNQGMMVREPWWEKYKFFLRKPYDFMICFQKDEPIGYMAYLKKDTEISIFEFVGNKDVLCAFLAEIKKWDEIEKVTYTSTPRLNEMCEILEDKSVRSQIVLRPGMMARVVDMEAFLKQYPFMRKLKVAIEIREDPYCPWNVGIYEIEHKKDSTKIKKVFETNIPVILMDAPMFAKVFFGNVDHCDPDVEKEVWEKFKQAVVRNPIVFADYF